MTLRRLALACTMALLAAGLMTLPPALAASPGAAVPVAHAAKDGVPHDSTDDATPDDSSNHSANDVPKSCDDASGPAGAGSDQPAGAPAGQTPSSPAASFSKHGADDPPGDDSRGGDGSSDTPNPSDSSSPDDTLPDDNSVADDGSTDDSADESVCAEPVAGVFDFATTEATLAGGSSRTIHTGHAVFRQDGTVRREIDLRSGSARATTAKRKAGKGKRTTIIAVVQRKVRAGQQVTLEPRLTSAGRKLLKRAKGKTLKTTVKTTFRPVHGKPRTYTTTLLLRR